MNLKSVIAIIALSTSIIAPAQTAIPDTPDTSGFHTHFSDSTLRLDYIFGGDTASTVVLLENMSMTPGWAGRRHNLTKLPLQGNGQITVTDAAAGDTLFTTSFSTLFQEWIATPESAERARAFENTFLIPMPRSKVNVDVRLFDCRRNTIARSVHPIDPADNLIADLSKRTPAPHRYIHRPSTPTRAIDVAILAEGYTAEEAEKFYSDAETAVQAILSHDPFSSHADDFNFVAVAAPSADSGVSVPRLGDWKDTAYKSNFGTFYSDRYLTTTHVGAVHDCLTNIPYEHIIILANTDEYGGGGIYNLYTLTTAGHKQFRPVVVHEFGHSFGGLADEYFYDIDDPMENLYPDGVEPWEQNITTLTDFESKWADMIPKNTPLPTPPSLTGKYPIGLYEGGGYRSHGVYRGSVDCRMRTNTSSGFCPVCVRSIERVINFHLGR